MKRIASAGLAGLLFGLGLITAGMANPAKVLGFLDIAGIWDPSLALVMAGAIAVAWPAFTLAKRREKALLGETMRLPAARAIDRRLLLGSLLFGTGWGLAGICPGPALVLASGGPASAALFLAAMLLGMKAQSWWPTR
ncbi:YeeE/YedE family protein [Chromobacterium sp. IIBBL 290-4]|uniref:YeeE/YedE family protein n=1 Tax=Chromobacterium sp. IIBBL 290-4 TaxID=2953890 RepID=UPI0020B67A96|nr:YeeE/YedE family protein [Chromobacterium sp. IIBBL 290-4]UTH75814.1 YeeE/YedE family protein [Chromobacterium sp. IIBBL 290-4]